MTQEVLKQALDALEASIAITMPKIALRNKAIADIKEALAEPTSADYAMGYAEGFNDACKKPAQPQQEPHFKFRECEDSQAKQPQQEPVRYEFQVRDGTWHPFLDKAHYENTVEDGAWPVRALYTSTPQRKPLADEEITEVWRELKSKNEAWSDLDFARAIEAAHGIKE
jgi:hypothetical protein